MNEKTGQLKESHQIRRGKSPRLYQSQVRTLGEDQRHFQSQNEETPWSLAISCLQAWKDSGRVGCI